MKEVTFLERLAERLLEGGFVRALKPKLEPVQVAKALAREMERHQIVGAQGPLVANDFVAFLHPDDLAAFSEFRASLERELAAYLRGYAARHGLRTLSSPTVRLLPADPPGGLGRVLVQGSLHDPAPQPPMSPAESLPEWEGTVAMPAMQPEKTLPVEETPPAPPEQFPASLIDDLGERFDLKASNTTIGRSVDNDIVLELSGVSRHHARILWESGQYILLDLGSTNGSFVAGKRVTRLPLSGGEQISFGGARFTFGLADPGE